MTEPTRRHFLKTAAAAALAGVGLRRRPAAAFAGKKHKFTLDLRCGSIGVGADQREAIRLAAKFGFQAVDPSAGELAKMADAELAGVVAELEAKHLVWGAAGLPLNFRSDEATFQAGMKQLPQMAANLQKAGVTRVGTWLSPTHDTLTYLANFKQHVRRLGQVAKLLDDHRLRFGLEYVGPKTSWTKLRYPFIHTMAEAKELIAAIGRDNVGLVLDSWHWYTARNTREDLLSLSNHDVVACDLNDAPAGIPLDQQMDLSRELPLATGVIDLKAFLGALVEIGYDGPVRAEPFNKPLNALANEPAVEATAAAMRKAFALVN